MRLVADPKCAMANSRGALAAKYRLISAGAGSVTNESKESPSLCPASLTADHRSREHSQGVEAGLHAVAVRIGEVLRLQHTIVEFRAGLVSGGVAGQDGGEVGFVVRYGCDVANGSR